MSRILQSVMGNEQLFSNQGQIERKMNWLQETVHMFTVGTIYIYENII